MAIPSKAEQIKAVAALLEIQDEEDLLEDIAKRVVEGYHDLITAKLKQVPSTPRLGMLFKVPVDNKVRRLVWWGADDRAWIVSETDSYGWLGDPAVMFEWCEEFRPRRRRDGKMVELTDRDIDEEWSNPDWKVGEVLSQHQRQYSFEVVAVSPNGALLRGGDGRLTVDSNSNLKTYYKREIKGLEGGW